MVLDRMNHALRSIEREGTFDAPWHPSNRAPPIGIPMEVNTVHSRMPIQTGLRRSGGMIFRFQVRIVYGFEANPLWITGRDRGIPLHSLMGSRERVSPATTSRPGPVETTWPMPVKQVEAAGSW